MTRILIYLLSISLCSGLFPQSKMDFPADSWQQYQNVAEAGYSKSKLNAALAFIENSEAAGLFITHRGRVLAAWGETNRRFMSASIRKSFINALIGIAVDQGKMDLDKTLADLQIDDINSLTSTEKEATVRQLLSARSGIYHPAAFSPRNMAKNLPARGSHKPGEFWFYNNWDFNTLVTIFEQATGEGIFEAFQHRIAQHLQFSDFQLAHTYYCHEPDKSQHPAYLFRMSARDLARFGHLYLNKGRWNGRQVVPEAWIAESTRPLSRDLGFFSPRGAYGYLWWVSKPVRDTEMFFASGSGGQRIAVLPEADLVIVQVVNSYQFQNVDHKTFIKLVEKILDARRGAPQDQPSLAAYTIPPRKTPATTHLADDVLRKYEGDYQHRRLGRFRVSSAGNKLNLELRIGMFDMLPTGPGAFWIPDIEAAAEFRPALIPDKKNKVDSVVNEDRIVTKIFLNY